MITDWIIDLSVEFALWLVALFPEFALDEAFLNGQALADILDWFDGLGVWVSWPVLVMCVGAVAGTWVIGYGIKAVRGLASHVPQLGGSGD